MECREKERNRIKAIKIENVGDKDDRNNTEWNG